MKKIVVVLLVVALLMAFCGSAIAVKPEGTGIKEGVLKYSSKHFLSGQPLTLGYDIFGYNYNAHMFNGFYANAYLGGDGFEPYTGDTETYLLANPDAEDHWTWEYRDIKLMMKWNDAWLSNMDRDSDGLLDRHYGFDSYIGSGAWLTNHEVHYNEAGEVVYESFCKIIAPPTDAYKDGGFWYSADGVEIGPVIWGAFAIIQDVADGEAIYNSPLRSGLGNW